MGKEEKSAKKKKGIFTKPKIFIFGLVLGVVVCFIAFYNLFPWGISPKQQGTLSPTTVFERVVAQDEMVSASQDYVIIDKATDANTFFDLFEIPFTQNSFWYRYAGTIKAGVNLKTAEIKPDGVGKILITLDKPYIISNEPDMDKSGALEENNNVLNPIHVEDVTEFEKKCKEESERQVVEDGGLLDEAAVNAEANIRNIFTAAFGDQYQIEFVYR